VDRVPHAFGLVVPGERRRDVAGERVVEGELERGAALRERSVALERGGPQGDERSGDLVECAERRHVEIGRRRGDADPRRRRTDQGVGCGWEPHDEDDGGDRDGDDGRRGEGEDEDAAGPEDARTAGCGIVSRHRGSSEHGHFAPSCRIRPTGPNPDESGCPASGERPREHADAMR